MMGVTDAGELAWYLFVALALVSGVLWHLCRSESDRGAGMYHPLWFLESEPFSDKGNTYRKYFIVVTLLAFLSLMVWASL